MTHRLSRPNEPLNPMGRTPMVASLRYRCACGNQELLSIQTVFDTTATEDQFVWAMRMLWRDMQTEVRQHLEVQDVPLRAAAVDHDRQVPTGIAHG